MNTIRYTRREGHGYTERQTDRHIHTELSQYSKLQLDKGDEYKMILINTNFQNEPP